MPFIDSNFIQYEVNRHMFSSKMKKIKWTYVKKALVIFTMLCVQLVGCGESEIKEERREEMTEIMELQPDEIKILSGMYIDNERIETGNLFSYQKDNLERYRFAKKYLLEKYPDYSFEIQYGEPKSKLMPQAEFTFISEIDEQKSYKLCVFDAQDSNDYYAEDNFYEAVFAEKYDAYLQDILTKEVEKVSAVNSLMPWTKGMEYGVDMTVEDVTSGQLELSANTTIYITDSQMTEAAFDESTEKIKNVIQNNHFYGSFKIYVFEDSFSIEELMKKEEKFLNYRYKDTFQNFREE